MQKLFPRILPLFAFFFCSCATVFAQQHIRIASFNIADFGEGTHPAQRELDTIAQMLIDANLDLIAIQEVGTVAGGETQLEALRVQMNQRVGTGQPQFVSWISLVTGDERYAILYRDPVVLGDDVLWLDDDEDPNNPRSGGEIFTRIPVAVPFEAGNFDFFVIIVHLAAGNKTVRRDEIEALRVFLMGVDPDEDDWIALGDFNRYLRFGAGSQIKAFDQLHTGTNRYRFPLLEAVSPNDLQIHKATTDAHSTTVTNSAPGTNNRNDLFDQFVITAGAFNEFGTTSPTLGQDVGIIAFDMLPPFDTVTDHNDVKFRVSDHRPIWIRFRIDQPDDD